MKKPLAIFLALSLLLGLSLSAHAEGGLVVNPEFNKEEMLTIHGVMQKIDDPYNLMGAIEMGFAFIVPEALNGSDMNAAHGLDFDYQMVGYVYIPEVVIELYRSMMNMESEEEYEAARQKIYETAVNTFAVAVTGPEFKNNEQTEERLNKEFEHKELLGQSGDNQIYLAYNLEFAGSQLTDKEKVEIRAFVQERVASIKEGLMLFPPQDYYEYYGYGSESIELPGSPESFNALDMDGNAFDAAAEFAKYDLTLVNVWYTGCNPCIEEMPALQELKAALPGNINFITVCLDTHTELELAAAILESVGATFTTLQGHELGSGVLQNVTSTPTTLFLDSTGRQVGDAIIGAMASLDKFVEQSMEIINERLAMIGL